MRAGATVVVITHDDRYLDELTLARAPDSHGRRPYCRAAFDNWADGRVDGERLMATYSEFLDEPPPPPKRGWWRFVGATCRASPSS